MEIKLFSNGKYDDFSIQGNALSLAVEQIESSNPKNSDSIGFTIGVNDGEYNDETKEFDVGTYVQFDLDLIDAKELALNILEYIEDSNERKVEFLNKMLDFKDAQIKCITGQVGKLLIDFICEDHKAGPSFYRFNLHYLDDVDQTEIATIEDICCSVGPGEDLQFEWMRSLVGGNHQYTSTIAIGFTNFTLQKLDDLFALSLEGINTNNLE